MKKGLLLINLGTPDNPDPASVRRYLREFLADRRVIDLPFVWRYLLLYGVILPFRPKKSAKAYQSIWHEHGSPLLHYSKQLVEKLQLQLGNDYQIALGMRYGNPSISAALDALSSCHSLTVLPLYPQYSSAATGSGIEKVFDLLKQQQIIPHIAIIRDFHQHPAFIKAQATQIKTHAKNYDYLLMSYHGLPERQLLYNDCQDFCLEGCFKGAYNFDCCYRAQCVRTTKALAHALNLQDNQYGYSFQSRLGRTPWIKPYTDEFLNKLSQRGIKKLAIVCPSFVTDCIETLEEIGIRAKEQWRELGGTSFSLVPALNAEEYWVKALLEISIYG